ncbi:MAG: dihydropteroate synthase [Alistipes sp.]|nr:dihydropteroate synthase [Alistipes sp.]
MAIVNVTPDSFYAHSRMESVEGLCHRIAEVIAEGATIVDVGGYSSRPGASEVSIEEEWQRVRMALQVIESMEQGVVVSVDTFRAEVVRRAVAEFGPIIVNDISAGELDKDMLSVVAEHKLPYIAMHMRGTPSTMQQMTSYEGGVVRGVVEYFRQRVIDLHEAGIEQIILDPGFGFAKDTEQNMELMRGIAELRALGYPILIGVSRKSMIYRTLGITPEESLPGSLALAWQALQSGDAILRVHDVGETVQVMRLAKVFRRV